jgi:hypothetical protein
MTIPRIDPDVRPRLCAGCGEIVNDPLDGAHPSCLPWNRRRPVPAVSWPIAKPADSSVARRALVEARALIQQLGTEVDFLESLRPDAPVESAADRRFRDTAHGRIEQLARELSAVAKRVTVARG